MADVMLAAVNRGIEAEERHFSKLGPPVAGGLSRAASQHRYRLEQVELEQRQHVAVESN